MEWSSLPAGSIAARSPRPSMCTTRGRTRALRRHRLARHARVIRRRRTWATGGALSFPPSLTIRSGPNDGLVLRAGGSASANASNPMKSAELYGFATVKTDKADYAPGTRVTITGSGWVPGETVRLVLV